MYCTSHLKYILALATALIVTAPVLVAAKGHYEPDSGSSPHVLQNAAKRQIQAIATVTSPDCPVANALFYVTPHNYTWQIQCATDYVGAAIEILNAANFSDCINQCAIYNHNNANTVLAACVAVTFNGGNDDGTGQCSLFSLILEVDVADEEGLIQDSALLIYNPAGMLLATPEPQPTLPPAPTLPPPPGSTLPPPPPTSTVLITSSVIISSCGPEVTNCPANSLPTSAISLTSATSSPSSPALSISVSIAGGKTPASSTGPSVPTGSSVPTMSLPTSLPIITVATSTDPRGQISYTELVPTIEYWIQQLVICTEPVPSPCFTETGTTETTVGYRTEVSCSPAPCTGSFATGSLAPLAATDICVANF